MEKTDILNKILNQSQLTAVIAMSDDNQRRMLENHYCFTEEIWEKMFQENKRNNVLETMVLKQNKKIKDLMAELEFYKD